MTTTMRTPLRWASRGRGGKIRSSDAAALRAAAPAQGPVRLLVSANHQAWSSYCRIVRLGGLQCVVAFVD